jgi:hypothetical protein
VADVVEVVRPNDSDAGDGSESPPQAAEVEPEVASDQGSDRAS